MKITVKVCQPLPKTEFEIDIDASETVADLKAKVKDSQGLDVEKQNLISCGRVLANDRTLESYRIEEEGCLVLLVSSPGPLVSKSLDPEGYFALSEEALTKFPLVPPPAPPNPENISPLIPLTMSTSTFKYVPMSTPATVVASTSASSAKSTFKYVPMSVPMSTPVSVTVSAPVPKSTFKYVPIQQRGTGVSNTDSGGSGELATVRNELQIAQVRELVTQNPQLRQLLIQQLAEDDPTLAQLFAQSPDLLTQVLDRIVEDGDASTGAPAVGLNVTDAEQGDIERLEALGFPKEVVKEAYFACDKNEELAANYLLEHA